MSPKWQKAILPILSMGMIGALSLLATGCCGVPAGRGGVWDTVSVCPVCTARTASECRCFPHTANLGYSETHWGSLDGGASQTNLIYAPSQASKQTIRSSELAVQPTAPQQHQVAPVSTTKLVTRPPAIARSAEKMIASRVDENAAKATLPAPRPTAVVRPAMHVTNELRSSPTPPPLAHRQPGIARSVEESRAWRLTAAVTETTEQSSNALPSPQVVEAQPSLSSAESSSTQPRTELARSVAEAITWRVTSTQEDFAIRPASRLALQQTPPAASEPAVVSAAYSPSTGDEFNYYRPQSDR